MNDLISRKDAIKALVFAEETGDMKCGKLREVLEVLNRVPPAQQWIPVKYRPMTEDEKEYWSEILEYEFDDNMMFDCQMPDDGQKILVCSKCGNIWIDTHEDDGGLMGLEENGDWEDIVAWMPLPEPYKEVE